MYNNKINNRMSINNTCSKLTSTASKIGRVGGKTVVTSQLNNINTSVRV